MRLHIHYARRLLPILVLAASFGHAGAGLAADPFSTATLTAETPGGSLAHPLRPMPPEQATPCAAGQNEAIATIATLTLPDVVDRALCNNPQTREAWANARYQAAQLGLAESAYLPALDLSLSAERNSGGNASYNQRVAALSLSYLIYDFGARGAALEIARQGLAASNASQDAGLQAVFLSAVQAYYQWHAAQALVEATRESERASQESLKGAGARYQAGTATPADKLQAQTAASQATLARIRAEGEVSNAQGNLANVMGLPANQPIVMAAPAEIVPDAQFDRKLAELIETARRQRPDLAAAEAQVLAAGAGIDAARATGMPSISLFANRNEAHNSLANIGSTSGNVVGVAVNIPLFSGFNTTYRQRAAEAQLDAKTAQRDKLALQVSLDVWRAYHALLTETQAVRAATDLLASASQSAQVAQGRYRAGVGGILDLLNAQSALASARQQHIQELYNWRLARVTLAQAMGQLDFAALTMTAAAAAQ